MSKDALIPILNRYYEEIAALEVPLGLVADAEKGDYRPRIERFHDAVRAYTSGVDPYAANTRLSVEWLAADVEWLRYLMKNPLAPLAGGRLKSAGTQLAVRESRGGRQGSAERGSLSDAYQKYAVLFVALLAETADMNFNARSDAHNAEVELMAAMQRAARGQKKVNLQLLAVQSGLDPYVAEDVAKMLPSGTLNAEAATAALKAAMQGVDGKIARIDKAHTLYLAGQLALYEQGKQMVQGLASRGMNLAGQFLANAMAAAQGRGAGRGF